AYVPEETAVYPRLTGWEHLVFYARLYLGDRDAALEVARRAAELTGLSEVDLRRRVAGYSKGMRRRLLLGLALALESPLLVLDEPTSGLDVFSAVQVRRLIREAARAGRAVLVTGHNMLEIERVADYVVLLGGGRVVAEGEPGEVVRRFGASDLEEAFVKAFTAGGGS
ncbi:MAG: ABC transporter ATP-binding protein, partial [Crenarchaeota archaeon]|nr:ABC transporter ATP-binding protein [Thermoproteota archaeon]